jgi:hypothetical protein
MRPVLRAALLLTWIVRVTAGCSSRSEAPFQTAAHVPYPQVPTGGGPTLASVPVVTVSFAGDSHTSDLTGFVDWLSQANWASLVAGEYGVHGIEHQAHVDLDASAPADVTDDDVQALLTTGLGDGALPSAPSSGSLFVYVVFYPDGTSVTRSSGANACGSNPGNGYHVMTTGTGANVAYVVVPSCDPRFSGLLSEVQGMELEAARLLIDTATDPSPLDQPGFQLNDESNPWSSMGPEVGDLCWGRLVQEGGYTLQRVWSNAAAAAGEEPCVPVPAGSVPFGVTASPSTLQTITAGVPLTFTVTGWSRAAVADWPIQATSWVGDYAIDVSLEPATLDNGQTAVLKVTVPFAQASGAYGAVLLRSLGPTDSPAWPVAFTVR